MNKFKAGDTVKRVRDLFQHSGDILAGKQSFVLVRKKGEFWADPENSVHHEDTLELTWTPVEGEEIETQYRGGPWCLNTFVGMIKDQYACLDAHDNDDTYACFKQARPIARRTITTEDGTKVELSAEQYQALLDGAIGGTKN